MTIIEYAIARKAAQLLALMNERELTQEEETLLGICGERVLEYEKAQK